MVENRPLKKISYNNYGMSHHSHCNQQTHGTSLLCMCASLNNSHYSETWLHVHFWLHNFNYQQVRLIFETRQLFLWSAWQTPHAYWSYQAKTISSTCNCHGWESLQNWKCIQWPHAIHVIIRRHVVLLLLQKAKGTATFTKEHTFSYVSELKFWEIALQFWVACSLLELTIRLACVKLKDEIS